MGLFGLLKPNVKKMEAKGDIEGLVKALAYKKDSHVRIEAAVALGKIGSRKVLDTVSQGLKDENSEVRRAVEKAIERIKTRK
jgi:HEAT repeat protein